MHRNFDTSALPAKAKSNKMIKKAFVTWDSKDVSDPSTNQAHWCLTCQIGRDGVRSPKVWTNTLVIAGRGCFVDGAVSLQLNAFLFEIACSLIHACTYAFMCAKHSIRTYFWCVRGENLIVLLIVVSLAFFGVVGSLPVWSASLALQISAKLIRSTRRGAVSNKLR